MVEKIKITRRMVRRAKQHHKYRQELRKDHKYTKFDTPDDAFIGKLGELSFEKFLNQHGFIKDTDYETQEGALYDDWDFKLTRGDITIDVKTAQTPYEPDASWYFGYGIMTKPERKDYIVICYVPKGLNDVELSQIKFGQDWLITSIMGHIEGFNVCNFKKTWYNTKAKFKYQIKAYDIPIKELYKDLRRLLRIESRDREE